MAWMEVERLSRAAHGIVCEVSMPLNLRGACELESKNPTMKSKKPTMRGIEATHTENTWPESQGGASKVVPSPNGAPKRALPRAAPHAPTLTRACDGNRLIAARRTRRAGRGSCARVSVRAQSADEYEPSWAHWLPQQPTLSRLKGSRQARSEQGRARGREMGSRPRSQQRTF